MAYNDAVPFYDDGLRFECQRCSACCRFEPGVVAVQADDEAALCAYLSLAPSEFKEQFCRRLNGMLFLQEKENWDCIFWEKHDDGTGGCAVYPARPRQCRTWPFWQSNLVSRRAWNDAARDCPGMDRGKLYTKEEIDAITEQ